MRARGQTDLAVYVGMLATDGEEFDALADDIVVPETWFFRGGAKLFQHLTEYIREAVTRLLPTRVFRVLSAPCSSGEEPYSLAMALTDAGVPPERWTIDAIDLSRRSLERACRGVYRESAFREIEPHLRDRYFRRVEAGWQLVPEVRGQVRFVYGNLVDALVLTDEQPFDLVFCRNLLIYLHSSAREQVLAALDRLLAPDGMLCTGHAEPLSLLGRRFRPTGPLGFFLHRRADSVENAPGARATRPGFDRETVGRSPAPPRVIQSAVVAPVRPTQATPALPTSLPKLERTEEDPDRLTMARRLADAGQLNEALAICQRHLTENRPSADLYSLLGVIHHARHERTEATACFHKALYLDPAHVEALTHLMLLCQEDGDVAGAARLRRRLERTAAGGEP
jgi:chemotaxis protein methyltransferase WspC